MEQALHHNRLKQLRKSRLRKHIATSAFCPLAGAASGGSSTSSGHEMLPPTAWPVMMALCTPPAHLEVQRQIERQPTYSGQLPLPQLHHRPIEQQRPYLGGQARLQYGLQEYFACDHAPFADHAFPSQLPISGIISPYHQPQKVYQEAHQPSIIAASFPQHHIPSMTATAVPPKASSPTRTPPPGRQQPATPAPPHGSTTIAQHAAAMPRMPTSLPPAPSTSAQPAAAMTRVPRWQQLQTPPPSPSAPPHHIPPQPPHPAVTRSWDGAPLGFYRTFDDPLRPWNIAPIPRRDLLDPRDPRYLNKKLAFLAAEGRRADLRAKRQWAFYPGRKEEFGPHVGGRSSECAACRSMQIPDEAVTVGIHARSRNPE